MKVRSFPIPLVLGVTVFFLGVTSCARRAVDVPPTGATPPVAAAPGEPSSPSPSTPPDATGAVTGELVPAFFSFDSYALSEAARAALDRNAKLLREQPGYLITIEGHCDERGTVEYNQALGDRRAGAARDYLIGTGVPSTSIQVISYGKERPFDEGHTEAAWATNRRAHFVLR